MVFTSIYKYWRKSNNILIFPWKCFRNILQQKVREERGTGICSKQLANTWIWTLNHAFSMLDDKASAATKPSVGPRVQNKSMILRLLIQLPQDVNKKNSILERIPYRTARAVHHCIQQLLCMGQTSGDLWRLIKENAWPLNATYF